MARLLSESRLELVSSMIVLGDTTEKRMWAIFWKTALRVSDATCATGTPTAVCFKKACARNECHRMNDIRSDAFETKMRSLNVSGMRDSARKKTGSVGTSGRIVATRLLRPDLFAEFFP